MREAQLATDASCHSGSISRASHSGCASVSLLSNTTTSLRLARIP